MKSIKKLTKTVAGSALLVGATLAGAASMGAAQDSGSSGMTLGDYPAPFVDDDGNVDSTVVVGESAATVDVVGGINVAGSLGNAAFMEDTVSASGGSFGWSATDGVSLDTRNDQLYFGQTIDEVRDTLTEQHLDLLQTTEAFSGQEDQEIEQYLYVGNQKVTFGQPGDADDEDPQLYVENPSGTVTTTNENDYLYKLQANFEDGVEFVDDTESDNRNDDVYDEEVEMFGETFTVADDSFKGADSGKLVLFGSQVTTDVSTGESQTIEVGGEEHTFEVVGVTGQNTAAIRIDGNLEEYNEDDEETLSGETVRIDNIIQTNSDNSQGTVQFAVGSERVVLEDGESVKVGEDEEDVEGTQVSLGGLNDGDIDSTPANGEELSSIEIAVAADDSDNEYVPVGDSLQDPVFEQLRFHFGGLNPDAGEGQEDGTVGEIEFSTDGDDTATVSYDEAGDSTTQGFFYDQNTDDSNLMLADSDGDNIIVKEGAAVVEDEYFVSDAGDFAHVWEVTDVDASDNDGSEQEEGTVDLQDTLTGASIEVEVDETANGDGNADGGETFEGTEVIDGQTYYFRVGTTNDDVHITYGNNAGYEDTGDRTSLYAAQDTDSGGAVAYTEELTDSQDTLTSEVYELPSTESTDDAYVDLNVTDSSSITVEGSSGVTTENGGSDPVNVTVNGGQVYQFTYNSQDTLSVNPLTKDDTSVNDPAAVVLQPEDENDNEESYVVAPGTDTTDDEVHTGGSSGSIYYSEGYTTSTLESDDDVEVDYNLYGTHTMQDTDEQGSFTLHIPHGQSVAGAAFTGEDGDLTAGGGTGSVDTMTPTGWGDHAALDSDSNIGSLKNNENLILVGGPAVNNLVSELASANKTWAGSDYSEGDQLLQLVEDAFTDGNHALVVAGYAGEDTRAAANFIADYEDNADDLAGETQLNLATN